MADITTRPLFPTLTLPIPSAPEGTYTLAPFSPLDAPAVAACLSLPSVGDNLIKVPKPYTLADAEFWINELCLLIHAALSSEELGNVGVEEKRKRFFALKAGGPLPVQVIRHEGVFIGVCTLTPVDGEGEKVELGYYLHPEWWGKGIMFYAAVQLLEFAREEFGIVRIYSTVDNENGGSMKTMARIVEETRVGEVRTGKKNLRWPIGKMGVKTEAERDRESVWWEWSNGRSDGHL